MLAINLLGYMQKPDNNPTVVDIFCSCGGLSEGFHQGGYNVLLELTVIGGLSGPITGIIKRGAG